MVNRRAFLAAASGAMVAPLISARAAPSCTGNSWLTVPPQRPCQSSPFGCPKDITGAVPILNIPPQGDIPDFAPGSCKRAIARPLWSELRLSRNRRHRQRLTDDLRRAYDVLICRPNTDPTSLLYQACLHDFYCSGGWTGGDIHGTWDFLPWHRAFLLFHERMLAKACGNDDFRLPVWDWETSCEIPQFYVDLGLPSFLTDPRRQPADPQTARTYFTEPRLRAWLLSDKFETFCGTAIRNSELLCNAGPHSAIHQVVVAGAMNPSRTSAADPIFYSHHANVDRFFRYWMHRYSVFPKPEEWLDRAYYLYDENGRLVRVKVRQILYEDALGYTYANDPQVCLNEYDTSQPATISELPGVLVSIHLGAGAMNSELSDAQAKRMVDDLMAGHYEVTPLPVRLRLKIDASATEAAHYEVVIAKGGQSAVFAGFGFFGHHMTSEDHDHPLRTVVATGHIDALFWKVLLGGEGTVELFYRAVGVQDARPFPIQFDENLGFQIIAPHGTVKPGKERLQQLGIKL